MVLIPRDNEKGKDPAAIEKRTQFLHDLGLLVYMWSRVELLVEFAIFRITGLSPLNCSIMLGSLQHKAKVSILYSLLREGDKTNAISKLKAAMSYARRNSLMHSVIASEDDTSELAFFYRSVDDRYKVTAHKYTPESFHNHVWKFAKLADEAMIELGIDEQDPETVTAIMEYVQKARFEGIEQ